MDTITDILARPGEAARQLTEMRAALEAVTARLVERDAELSELRLAVQRDILSRLDVTVPQLAAVTAERDAARAEVARLTELLSEAITGVGYAVTFGNMVSKCETIDNCGDPDAVLYLLGESQSIEKRLRAALRGDTAPAKSLWGMLTPEMQAITENACTCEHVLDGDDVAYTIRDRSCPVHAAPAGRE